jgi:hypothetical protein
MTVQFVDIFQDIGSCAEWLPSGAIGNCNHE